MQTPRFTIRRMMVVVGVVALVLASARVGPVMIHQIERQMSKAKLRFDHGTTAAGEGIAPDR